GRAVVAVSPRNHRQAQSRRRRCSSAQAVSVASEMSTAATCRSASAPPPRRCSRRDVERGRPRRPCHRSRDSSISVCEYSRRTNQTGRQSTEERQNLRTPKLLAQNRRSLCIDPVHLKNMLRQVKSDRSNLAHGWLPFAADSIAAVWHSDAARGPSTPSFDHLIGAQQERFRDRQPEPFGGGQIDDEIELGRLFNRKLARLGAAQDLVDVVDLRRRLSNLHPPPGPGISVDRSVDRIAARANSTSFVHDFSYLARWQHSHAIRSSTCFVFGFTDQVFGADEQVHGRGRNDQGVSASKDARRAVT